MFKCKFSWFLAKIGQLWVAKIKQKILKRKESDMSNNFCFIMNVQKVTLANYVFKINCQLDLFKYAGNEFGRQIYYHICYENVKTKALLFCAVVVYMKSMQIKCDKQNLSNYFRESNARITVSWFIFYCCISNYIICNRWART